MGLINYNCWIFIIFCLNIQRYNCQYPQLNDTEIRIVGGVPATFDGTRHQVALYRTGYFTCGGSVISPTAVLTAAHCVVNRVTNQAYPASDFSIVTGTLTLNQLSSNALKIKVARLVHHAGYLPSTCVNDIAILFLEEPIPENHSIVKRIKISTKDPQPGTLCRVNGWGSTCSGGRPTNDLRTVNVSIVDKELCKTQLSIYDGMICAGNWFQGGQDSCQGDSGGPFQCGEDLVGVVSWGIGCGLPRLPGVYTSTAYYLDWIKENGGLTGIKDESASAVNLTSFSVVFVLLIASYIMALF